LTGPGIRTRWRQTSILLLIAFRNLFASRAKSLIVGGIILFGALLVVVGGSIVDSIDSGMRRSIQGSLAGDLQVYNAKSKDELALYGNMMGEADIEPIEDFAKLKKTLLSVPNVKSVVPMGIDQAMVGLGNLFDVALARLRDDVRACTADTPAGSPVRPCAATPETKAQYEAHKAHVRRMVTLLRADLSQAAVLVSESLIKEREQNHIDLARAVSSAFWEKFDADPLDSLEFLENKIAPQSIDGAWNFVRYVGTDIDAFQTAFEGTRIVEGTTVPSGRRGIILGKLYAEDYLKLRTARRLDKIKDARNILHKEIASDEELTRWVKENQAATRDILLQLDPIRAEEATRRLQKALHTSENDLHKLIVTLLTTDDRNFNERYRIFYDELAPLLQLYSVKIGDFITIQAPARSGYMNSVNVKVYGFVEFKGLEKSGLAGIMSLMDIMTFRDLYGFMTAEQRAEIRKLKKAAAVPAVTRESAEADLFGEGATVVGTASSQAIDEQKLLQASLGERAKDDLTTRVYTQQEIDRGVAKNAAVILKDPRRASKTTADILAATKAAGMDLKVVDWQQASGMIGQFVTLARVILYVAVFIIFAVALVIINNAMVMATLQRVKEIGTLRAIGAQRRFVLQMLLIETVAVGLMFGAIGAGFGAGVVWLIGAVGGIPAANDQLYFFFSGPSLIPHLGASTMIVSLVIVFLVSMLSALYPAWLATRVAPLVAMQSDE
jgi:ABC-type lipoprotein release transport system permease subunit